MAESTVSQPALRPSRNLAGIICIVVGMWLFVGQDVAMKDLLTRYTLWMLISARAIMAVLILVPLIIILGRPHRLLTPLWPLHFARALMFAFGFSLFYTAFPFMGLAEVTTLFFSAPLMTAVIAALFLGEHVGPQRIACLIIGFIGVVIAMNPTGDTFQWIAILPLICALSYAISQVIARQIGERETTLTLGLYTVAFSGLFMMPMGYLINQVIDVGPEFSHIGWQWHVPAGDQLLILAALGTNGMIGYMLISRAYQVANASLVAPFDYSYLPFATLVAYLVFDEVPPTYTIVGMVLIIGSGLYLGYREVRQAEVGDAPVPTGEVSFLPGAPVGAVVHAADTQNFPPDDEDAAD